MSRARKKRSTPPDAVEPALTQSPVIESVCGGIDQVSLTGRVRGWCYSPATPAGLRAVVVLVDGVVAAHAACDQLRDDLGVVDALPGEHGFEIELPPAVCPLDRSVVISLKDLRSDALLGEPKTVQFEAQSRVAAAEMATPSSAVTSAPAKPVLPVAFIDQVAPDGQVLGWSWHPAFPEQRICLDVLVDGEVVGSAVASELRPDLRDAGIGDGEYGFHFVLPWSSFAKKAKSVISVRERGTGLTLGQPTVLRRRVQQETEERILELEQQVRLLQSELQRTRELIHRQDDFRAAQQLFQTVGGFFLELAAGRGLPAQGTQALGDTLSELTARHPPLTLRTPAAPKVTIVLRAEGDFATLYDAIAGLHREGIDRQAEVLVVDADGFGTHGLLPAIVRNLRYARLLAGETLNDALLKLSSDQLVFLSPFAVLTSAGLAQLSATLSADPTLAMVAPLSLHADGSVAHEGFRLDTDPQNASHDAAALLGAAEIQEGSRQAQVVDAVADLVFVVKRGAFTLVDGLDLSFDTRVGSVVDLSGRLKQRGLATCVDPRATVTLTTDNHDTFVATRPSIRDVRRLRLAAVG